MTGGVAEIAFQSHMPTEYPLPCTGCGRVSYDVPWNMAPFRCSQCIVDDTLSKLCLKIEDVIEFQEEVERLNMPLRLLVVEQATKSANLKHVEVAREIDRLLEQKARAPKS